MLLSPNRARRTIRRAVLAGAGLALMLPAIAEAQERVFQVWHTEPNPATRGVMDEIIADFVAMHPDVRIEHEAVVGAIST